MLLKIILSFVFILAVSGCAENRSSFFIQNMVVPSDECVVSNDRESQFRLKFLRVGFRCLRQDVHYIGLAEAESAAECR